MPPISHVIYIPMILLFGIVLGFILANKLLPASPKKKSPSKTAQH